MKRVALALCLVGVVGAQTTLWLRDSTPGGVAVVSYDLTVTPITVTTLSAHGLTAGDDIWIDGTCQTGGSNSNGHLKVYSTPTSATLTLADTGGSPLAAANPVCNWGGETTGAVFVGKVHAYTLTAGPLGVFDGATGIRFQKLAKEPTSITVSGAPVATVVTIVINGYDATAAAYAPLASGGKLSINGTTSTALNTHGGQGAQYPYTVNTVTYAAGNTTIVTTAEALTGTSSGSFGANNACGVSGTANCVRISQLAWVGNIGWDHTLTQSQNAGQNDSVAYKYRPDGGRYGVSGTGDISFWTAAVLRYLVDPSDTQMRAVLKYFANNIERAFGVNFLTNSDVGEGTGLLQYVYGMYGNIGAMWSAVNGDLTSGEKTTFLNKIWNDWDISGTSCTNSADMHGANSAATISISTGTAQAGSGTSITLAAGDAHADNFYTNMWARWTVSTKTNGSVTLYNYSYGRITGYTASTKVAAVSGGWTNGSPTTGSSYQIIAGASFLNTGNGSTTFTGTITGYGTNWNTTLHVGDSVVMAPGWSGDNQFYVSAIASDTSASVVYMGSLITDNVSYALWITPKWASGQCGMKWMNSYWKGFLGVQPGEYYPTGGELTAQDYGIYRVPAIGANQSSFGTLFAGAVAMANDDARAAFTAERSVNFGIDFELTHWLQYVAGDWHNGGAYNYQTSSSVMIPGAAYIQQSIPSFPSLDLAGNWVRQWATAKPYMLYPNYSAVRGQNSPSPTPSPMQNGQQSGYNNALVYYLSCAPGWLMDYTQWTSSTTAEAKYFRNFLATFPMTPNNWSYMSSLFFFQVFADPTIPTTTDYTTQPHQVALNKTSITACQTFSTTCDPLLHSGMVISHTGWPSVGNWANGHLYISARAYNAGLVDSGYDSPEFGSLWYFKATDLLRPDSAPPGSGNLTIDTTLQGDVVNFGGAAWGLLHGKTDQTPATSSITQWASANHGSWDTQYGDQSSKYMRVCQDPTNAYNVSFNYFKICEIHKKESGDEFIGRFVNASTTTSQSITLHLHYVQNGQTALTNNSASFLEPEGNTTCPGSGGCASLDTNRVIQSLQGNTAVSPDITPAYGLVTKVFTPGKFIWDCPGGGECSPGSTYPGGNGNTDRASICGGASCGASTNYFESMDIHKVMANISDTSLTATEITGVANWKITQSSGVNDSLVWAEALGSGTQATMGGFTTTHSGTAQYILGGLTAGTYTVTVNGSGVTGSPFTVASGDNSIEFVSTAGTVSVNGSAPPAGNSTTVGGSIKAAGSVVIK